MAGVKRSVDVRSAGLILPYFSSLTVSFLPRSGTQMSNNQRDGVLPKATQLEMLTVKDVAGLLRAQPSSIYAWAKEGKIPAFKINGILRFDLSEVREWIGKSRISPVDIDKQARKMIKRSRSVDIDGIVRRAVDTIRGSGISSFQGATRSNQVQKGGS